MREVLLEKYRARLAQFPRQADEWNWRVHCYGPKVAALESGAPLVLQGWQIGHQHLPGEPDPHGDYCIETDGRVVKVWPVFDVEVGARTVTGWRRADGSSVGLRGPIHES